MAHPMSKKSFSFVLC